MPEIVRKHTHVHKVYKLVEPSTSHGVLHSKWQPQPHISLLGYTTTASGTGHLMPDLTQLLATPTPTLTPNYGPALFDNKYLSESQPNERLAHSDLEKEAVQPAGKLLQQLFQPNIADETAATHSQTEPSLEHNELLNSNFLAALQREYFTKFGSKPTTKRQKPSSFLRVKPKPKTKPKPQPKSKTKSKYKQQQQQRESEEYASNYLQDFRSSENFDEEQEDEEEFPSHASYAEQYEQEDSSSNPFFEDEENAMSTRGNYDSASAFSRLNNGLSFLPTPDEFLNDINGPNSYAANTYADLYDDDDDDYGPTGTGWKTLTKPTSTSNKLLLRHRQRRRPALDMTSDGTGWAPSSSIGSTSSSSSTASGHNSGAGGTHHHHMRFPKLINRRKRKNRIKSKIYRI